MIFILQFDYLIESVFFTRYDRYCNLEKLEL